jgi:hypothetical protein
MQIQPAANSTRRGDSTPSRLAHEIFSTKLFLALATTRALHFLRQENFLVVIENKIHFFLVAFATDF